MLKRVFNNRKNQIFLHNCLQISDFFRNFAVYLRQNMETTRQRLYKEYAGLVKSFADAVAGLPINGIPAPSIPIVGKNYDACAYKMAFIGMETKETNTSRNCRTFIEDPQKALRKYENWLDNNTMFIHGEKSVYWRFIKHFLEHFYSPQKPKKFKKNADGRYHEILSSFIWGNANAIERYEVTAKANGVDRDVWKKVKKASKPFDDIRHIIEAAHPSVVFITYKHVKEKYFLHDEDIYTYNQCSDGADVVFGHYYLHNQDTHVFVTPHPNWIARRGLSEKYISALLSAIQDYEIWPNLPKSIDDWNQENG